MAFVNKGKVRILRGNLNSGDENDVVGNTPLWDGQPFYDKQSGKLFVGNGDGTKIKDTNPINAGHSDTSDYSDISGCSNYCKNEFHFIHWVQHDNEVDDGVMIVDLELHINPKNLQLWNGVIIDEKNQEQEWEEPTPIKIKEGTSKFKFVYTENNETITKAYTINYDWWALNSKKIKRLYEQNIYTFCFNDGRTGQKEVLIDPVSVNEIQEVDFSSDTTAEFGDYIVSKKKLLWSGNVSISSSSDYVEICELNEALSENIKALEFVCMDLSSGNYCVKLPLGSNNKTGYVFDSEFNFVNISNRLIKIFKMYFMYSSSELKIYGMSNYDTYFIDLGTKQTNEIFMNVTKIYGIIE